MIQRIVNEVMVAYQSPPSVNSVDGGKVWIASFTETVLAESHNAAEILSAWVQFKRSYDRAFWPVPGQFCKTIRELRAEASQYRRHAGPMLNPPDYHKPELVSETTRNRTLTALAQADVMGGALGKMLTKLGLSIIERNGPPRPDVRWPID